MTAENQNFCFCTLALGERYHEITKDLIADLAIHAPHTKIVIYTDNPAFFKDDASVLAFPHRQEGILHCYHDKRFAIAQSLSRYPAAIFIDADTRVVAPVPENMTWEPGMTACGEDIVAHISRWTPKRLDRVRRVAEKREVSLEGTYWIGEALLVIARDGGREKTFLEEWGKIGRYLELKGIHAGSGNAIGLAAAKAGLQINQNTENWKTLNKLAQHFDESHNKKQRTAWEKLQRRLAYHFRLNKARIAALPEFDFYYR